MAGTTEIKNFVLTFDGLIWINHRNGRFPLLMSLQDLTLMFDREGLDIRQPNARDDCGCDAYHFNKITLHCNHVKLHELRNEYGEDCSPEWCWMKE
jgi:hypothetical protein